MAKNILIIISWLKIWWWAEKSATMVGNWLHGKWHNIYYLTFYSDAKKQKYRYTWTEYSLNENLSKNPLTNFIKLFTRAWQIKKFSQKNKIDTIISFMEEANFPNVVSKLLGWKSRIIVSIRSNVNLKSKLYKFLIRCLYPYADYITTIAKEEISNLVENYWIAEDKVSNIYNIFDVTRIKDKSKEDLWSHRELFNNWKFTYITIWRLSKPKNQEMLLNAFNKFHKTHSNSQLIILWDWKLKWKLINQKNNLQSRNDIHFLWIDPNPYRFLANSDCFVFSSAREWFGRVIVEAMVCWLPVVSTDCPFWPKEILKKKVSTFDEVTDVSMEEYGVLVPNKDCKRLTQAMEIMYTTPDMREKYRSQSLIRWTDFDTAQIIDQWENIL